MGDRMRAPHSPPKKRRNSRERNWPKP